MSSQKNKDFANIESVQVSRRSKYPDELDLSKYPDELDFKCDDYTRNLDEHYEKRMKYNCSCWLDVLSNGQKSFTKAEYENASIEAYRKHWLCFSAEMKFGRTGGWNRLCDYYIDNKFIYTIVLIKEPSKKNSIKDCLHFHQYFCELGSHKRAFKDQQKFFGESVVKLMEAIGEQIREKEQIRNVKFKHQPDKNNLLSMNINSQQVKNILKHIKNIKTYC